MNYKFAWKLFTKFVACIGLQLMSANANKFVVAKLKWFDTGKRINDNDVLKFWRTCRDRCFFTVVKRQKAIKFFKTYVIFRDSDKIKLIVGPELNADSDFKFVGRLSKFRKTRFIF